MPTKLSFDLENTQERTWEHDYLDLLAKITRDGDDRDERTGTGTRALFGERLEIDLRNGFPAMTTKKLAWKAVVSELLWFLEGSGDERRLAEILHGTRDPEKKTIWSANAEATSGSKFKPAYPGDLGRIYGVQWRHWRTRNHVKVPDKDGHIWHLDEEIDQVKELVTKLRTNPTDRRMIISAWNVSELDQMALPPCHILSQFFVTQDKNKSRYLSCQMYQRSVDTAIGLPFNIASYALLTHLLAHVTNCVPHRLIMNLGDTHVYWNHFEGVEEQLTRKPTKPPFLLLNPEITEIDHFKLSDIALMGYDSQPAIKMDMNA